MSRVCSLTGKKVTKGHNVSHSKRRTKRTFIPNLIEKKVFDNKLGRYVTMRISAAALRNLTKELSENADKIYASMNVKK